mmetsp:Transcript_21899/g.33294  ORF Transcript_21899/g.33294 Transcript_21899/m.33294 type:complete len:82 (+) Transcript_21899:113-358(+)|eukprot:CAMPEP_0197736620 /NCGR_PEP_ID=MMETSP1435-20131217/2355_1 /TAXON_ID=426625 /ORGANISM="Chaetoceros brevis, Strain CCMP164" /LENGTH=81 /DNA_ID=CAMNT_0043324821 /DNA_START=23 /DNA_END=268 /DNA_ORIENTATION=-
MIRQIFSKILPSLDRDLSRAVQKEVSSMEDLMLLAPRVFSYQKVHGGSGAFGRTQSVQSNKATEKLIRVEKPVTTKGLFSD